MVVRFTMTYAISAYHHWRCEFESHSGELYSIDHYPASSTILDSILLLPNPKWRRAFNVNVLCCFHKWPLVEANPIENVKKLKRSNLIQLIYLGYVTL
jgi:hypothetical protein